MRKAIVLSVVAVMAIAIAASPASAVHMTPGQYNTYGGGAVAEDAGYKNLLTPAGTPAGSSATLLPRPLPLDPAAGTQAAAFSFPGSEVSIDPSGVVNLPQAAVVPGYPPIPIPSPAAAIMETTQVKDGGTYSFPPPAELTMVLGGLWPTSVVPLVSTAPPGGIDNGLAPGSTPLDGFPDQLAPGALGWVQYAVTFGPATGLAVGVPVFECYDDVPTIGIRDLDIGFASTNLEEMHFDFDGAPPGIPNVPPVTAAPSQFVNAADAVFATVPNQVVRATDPVGSLWAAGWIDTATAIYTFFDGNVFGSGAPSKGLGPNGGYVYSVEFTALGVVTEGAVLPLLVPQGTASDGFSPLNISFATTLYGEAFLTTGNPLTDGIDPYCTWDLRTSLAGNSGDASFTIFPIPEPSTMALLGIGLVPLFFRRRKKSV